MGFHSQLPPRFPTPPLSSRTVGFPESGWRAWYCDLGPSRNRLKLKHWLAYAPRLSSLTESFTPAMKGQPSGDRGLKGCSSWSHQVRETLCHKEALPPHGQPRGATWRGFIIPPRRRSY